MTGTLLLLIAAYVLLGTLVLALCLFSHWQAWLKTALVLIFGTVFLFSYDAALLMLGSPTTDQLPSRFVLHDVVIHAPEQSAGLPGAVYLWVTPLSKGLPNARFVPRAHRIPYKPATVKGLSAAQDRLQDGIIQIGEINEPEQIENTSILGRLLGVGKPPDMIEFNDLPSPALPEK